jgi:ArsR family transcriptional regulator
MSTAEHADRMDAVFKALASKPRREILAMLASGGGAGDSRCGGDEICACMFAEKLRLSAPTVSHHMKALLDAGFVSASKRGLWVYYRLVPETLASVAEEFAVLVGSSMTECRPVGRPSSSQTS